MGTPKLPRSTTSHPIFSTSITMATFAVASTAPVCLQGLKALPTQNKVQAKASAARVVRSNKVCVASAKRSAAVASVATAPALVALQANAAELMASAPQEVAELAGITPVFYVGFLVGALGFTLVTYVALNKIELI